MIRRARASIFFASVATLSIIAACERGPGPKEVEPLSSEGDINEKVIYGDDNRKELYQETDPALKALADSTVVLLEDAAVGPSVGGYREIKGTTFKTQFGLCADEPFANQIAAGFCSGFLVSPNTIATAGHCIRDAQTCSTTWFAFSYSYASPSGDPRRVPSSEVYKCKQILRREENSSAADFAVIELDRPVTGHKPLAFRKTGAVPAGASLAVMGYPSGLPLKIAAGANVRDPNPTGYFVANLDTYGGNSGSAVFNLSTKLVEGILVRGEQDFVLDGNCTRSNKCGQDACRGEDVTKITEAVPYIPTYKTRKKN